MLEIVITSRTVLKNASNKYFKYCNNNPLEKRTENKGGESVQYIPRPYMLVGVCKELGMSLEQYEREYDTALAEKKLKLVEYFRYVNDRIFEQNASYAIGGIFKENIISKIHKLTESSEVTLNENDEGYRIIHPKLPEEKAEALASLLDEVTIDRN